MQPTYAIIIHSKEVRRQRVRKQKFNLTSKKLFIKTCNLEKVNYEESLRKNSGSNPFGNKPFSENYAYGYVTMDPYHTTTVKLYHSGTEVRSGSASGTGKVAAQTDYYKAYGTNLSSKVFYK